MNEIVLGIDPGTLCAGYSIVQLQGSRIELLESGVCKLPRTESLARRIGLLHKFLDQKIRERQVNVIALETPFLGKNAQNFLKLGYVRGIIYLLHDAHATQLCEFSPAEVKRAITGSGSAEKEQVARMVQRLFPQVVMLKTYDMTDAIAVSLCGVWSLRMRVLQGQ